MVSTIQLKPPLLLQPYVSCYALREFDSETGFPRPQYAQPEYYLSFFLRRDKFCNLIDESGKFHRNLSHSLVTSISEYCGYVYFKGNFLILSVVFKGNGLFAVFGIPQRLLINKILPVQDVLGNDSRLLTEQLESSKDVHEMAGYLNTYLTKKFLSQKQKFYTTTIAAVSNCILKNKGIASIDKLAHDANMGLRNFERRFISEIGVPPKLYMRITRFFNAIQSKMLHPEKTWTTITYESGYFDQPILLKTAGSFVQIHRKSFLNIHRKKSLQN